MPRDQYQDLDKEDMAAIQDIAARHGYTIGRGLHSDKGSRRQLERAIIKGEVALVLLPDEQRGAAMRWLFDNIDLIAQQDWIAAEGLKSIAESLEEAIKREMESEEE